MVLARDAMSSGDLVMAENYLQHAEHYNRIIMAAQSPQRSDDPGNGQQFGSRFDTGIGEGDFGSDDDYDGDEREQPAVAAEQPVQQAPDTQSERPERRFPHRQHDRQGGDFRGDNRGDFRGEQRPEARADNRGDRGEPRGDNRGEPRVDNRGDRGEYRGNRRRGRFDNGGNGRGPRPATALTPGGPAEAAALAAANAGFDGPPRRRPNDDSRDDGQPSDDGLV